MENFFEVINNLNTYYDNVIATVVEGECIGEKIILSQDNVLFESHENSFLSRHKKEILADYLSGCIEIEGQKVFCELQGSEKKLVICGGGHVSIPIIKMGRMLDFTVTVIEDRPLFADHARIASANEVICDDFAKALKEIKGDKDTYFVIVTRGHRFDQVCLEEIMSKPHAYIGMIGSKIRIKKVKELMMEKNFSKEELDKVYAPIGLNIGAETPQEIAVSIMAEVIQVKNAERRNGGFPKEILKAIAKEETKKVPKMLATIVSRKGSAPRQVGTKMLIYRDGSIVGTIGGGCVEADICRNAQVLLSEDNRKAKLYSVDMTGNDAEEDGMVCGGVVEILLEPIL
ncbi:MAG: XdhC/CoxI family protein [Mobilitalea sp.]